MEYYRFLMLSYEEIENIVKQEIDFDEFGADENGFHLNDILDRNKIGIYRYLYGD